MTDVDRRKICLAISHIIKKFLDDSDSPIQDKATIWHCFRDKIILGRLNSNNLSCYNEIKLFSKAFQGFC